MKNYLSKVFLSCLAAGFLSLNTAAAPDGKNRTLLNLPPSGTPRVKVTDRVWSATPGDAQVCLWKDDKLGAVTVTIDDNCAPDHEWWLETGKKYNFKFTWFINTGFISGDPRRYQGTWDHFRKLFAAGHDVQSHTAYHLGRKDITPEEDYLSPIAAIEKNIPGCRVLTMASRENEYSRNHFIANRETYGTLNDPAKINYRATCSLSGYVELDKPRHWAYFPGIFDPSSRNFRAWCCIHYHGLNPQKKADTIRYFDYFKEHEADLWITTFRELVTYAQERDTAELKITANTPDEIKFILKNNILNMQHNVL